VLSYLVALSLVLQPTIHLPPLCCPTLTNLLPLSLRLSSFSMLYVSFSPYLLHNFYPCSTTGITTGLLRKDSQTTCESVSLQTSHNSSRRNSGASTSAGLWSRRNSDADTRRDVDQQMFPDVTPAKTCSAESGAHRVTVKQALVSYSLRCDVIVRALQTSRSCINNSIVYPLQSCYTLM
jgi:hypothetical protein